MELSFRRASSAGTAPALVRRLSVVKQPRAKRFQNATRVHWNFRLLNGSKCCKRRCWLDFDPDKWEDSIIQTQSGRNEQELTSVIAQKMMLLERTPTGRFRYALPQTGKCCLRAWCAWYGLGRDKHKACRIWARNGSTVGVHGNRGANDAPHSAYVSAALHALVDEETDTQVDGTKYLSRHWSPEEMHTWVCIRWHEDAMPRVHEPSIRVVRRVWNSDPTLRNVRIPLSGQWGICDVCLELAERRRKGFRTEMDRAAFVADQTAHRIQHRAARAGFERRRLKSISLPHQYHHYTIDITRSSFLPHRHPIPKSLLSAKRLEVKLGGLLGFHSDRRVLFAWLPRFAKSADIIATVLLHAILADKTAHSANAHAEILFLQFDGGSENINRWILALCALLVDLNLYKEVYLSRMVVGHTHSIIDQFFRALRARLLKSTLSDGAMMVESIRSAYVSSSPTIALIEEVINFKQWIGASLLPFEGIRKPLAFLFLRDAEGRIGFRYKAHPELSPQWIGANGVDGTPVLAYSSRPRGQPGIRIDAAVPVEAVRRTLEFASESFVGKESARWLNTAHETGSWQATTLAPWQRGDFGRPCVLRVGSNAQPAVILGALPPDAFKQMADWKRAPTLPAVPASSKYQLTALVKQGRQPKPKDKMRGGAGNRGGVRGPAPIRDLSDPRLAAAFEQGANLSDDSVRPSWMMRRVHERYKPIGGATRKGPLFVWLEDGAGPEIVIATRRTREDNAVRKLLARSRRYRSEPFRKLYGERAEFTLALLAQFPVKRTVRDQLEEVLNGDFDLPDDELPSRGEVDAFGERKGSSRGRQSSKATGSDRADGQSSSQKGGRANRRTTSPKRHVSAADAAAKRGSKSSKGKSKGARKGKQKSAGKSESKSSAKGKTRSSGKSNGKGKAARKRKRRRSTDENSDAEPGEESDEASATEQSATDVSDTDTSHRAMSDDNSSSSSQDEDMPAARSQSKSTRASGSASSSSAAAQASPGAGSSSAASNSMLPPPPRSPARVPSLRIDIPPESVGKITDKDAVWFVSDHIDIRKADKAQLAKNVTLFLALNGFTAAQWKPLGMQDRRQHLLSILPAGHDPLTKLPSLERAIELAREAQQRRAAAAAASPASSSAAATASPSSARPQRERKSNTRLRGNVGELAQETFAQIGNFAIIQMKKAASGLQWSLGKIVDSRIKGGKEQIAVEWWQPAQLPPNLFGAWKPQKDPLQTDSGLLSDFIDVKTVLAQCAELPDNHLPPNLKSYMNSLGEAEYVDPAPQSSSSSSSSSSASSSSAGANARW